MVHNLKNAGYPIGELVWVDNGSTDGVREVMKKFGPAVSVLHDRNLGVAKGYNRAFALATGDWIVLTGCDMLMPDKWLEKMVEYTEAIPTTDVVAMFSVPFAACTERLIGEMNMCSAGNWQKAIPMGRRMMRRSVLSRAGYLREDFGLYGWEDVEWARRCVAKGLNCYAIPGMVAEHLGTEGVKMFDGKGDSKDYHAFKQEQVKDPAKIALMHKCQVEGYPFYTPFP